MKSLYNLSPKLNKDNFISVLLNIYFFVVIVAGIYTSFFMNSVNRSLWIDESALAVSFCKRSLLELTSAPLERLQSAPVGWLYIVKILAIIFGYTEYVLRIFSVISYIGVLILLYILSNRIFHMKYPLSTSAFVASMPFMLQYSNVFKPYMTDGVCVLLVLLLFYAYDHEKISFIPLSIAWAILIWFSNPVCFIAGGLIICQGIFILIQKNWTKLKELIIISCALVTSFVIYYFYWLRDVAIGDGMQNAWDGKQFPLIPTSKQDIITAISLINEIFVHFGAYKELIFLLLIVAFIVAVWKKNKYILGIFCGLLLCLFASYISMFPVQDRMWCFFYPLMSLTAFYGLDAFIKKTDQLHFSHIIVGLICVIFVISNRGIQIYSKEENVYWKNQETNGQMEYLSQNITEDDTIYVYVHSTPAFWFKNGYYTNSFGGYADNVIYGTTLFQDGYDYENELQQVLTKDSCYLMLSHSKPERILGLMQNVQDNGYLELIYNEYDTPIYYYFKDSVNSKLAVNCDIISHTSHDNLTSDVIRIHNIGDAYINHDYETVVLASDSSNLSFEVPKLIAPGDYADVTVTYPENEKVHFVLRNSDGVISALE